MKEFTFLADPNNPINWRATKLHEYKMYLIVPLGLQIEAQMKHNLDLLLQRSSKIVPLKQISKFY